MGPSLFGNEPSIDNQLSIDGQRSYLFIVVDKLNKDAKLVGLWALLYAPGSRNPIWVPIYPPIPGSDPSQLVTLQSNFHLDRHLHPSNQFLRNLQERNLTWNGYILADGQAIVSSLEYLNADERPVTVSDWLTEISPENQEDTGSVLNNQTQILRSLCSAAATQEADIALLGLLPKIYRHLRSDIDLENLFGQWQQSLQTPSQIECEFPASTASQ